MQKIVDHNDHEAALRSGFVAVIGRPNVGKSSLVNALVGQKVSIVSNKPQTTRNRIMGVVNGKGYQFVLVDTPGIQTARNRLGALMEDSVKGSLSDIDAVLVVIDGASGLGERDEAALKRASQCGAPVLCAINKIDLMDTQKRQCLQEAVKSLTNSQAVFLLSAKTGEGLHTLLNAIVALMPTGFAYFPKDEISDKPESFLCAEIIREKALDLLSQEVPHGIGVELEKFMERDDGIVEIHAVIYCEKQGHKAIVIGKNGQMLKKIGTMARQELEELFGAKTFLSLYVKARDDWRNNPHALKDLGYE